MSVFEDLENVRGQIINLLKMDNRTRAELENLKNQDLWDELISCILEGKLNMEERGCFKAVVGFLKHGMKKLVCSGASVLHLAVLAQNEVLMRTLLRLGACVDARDDCGATPLYLAVDEGQLEAAAVLLARGADINAGLTCYFRKGFTPLHAAALRSDADAVRLLLLHGADMEARDDAGATPLYTAVEWGNEAPSRVLVSAGADINTSLSAPFKRGYTGLHVASESGKENMVALLLTCGADPNLVDAIGASPLQIALETEHYAIAETILRSPILNGESTPQNLLHVAAARNRPEMVRLALLKEVKVNDVDINGLTALHISAEKGYDDIVRQLLKNGADVDHPTLAGLMPIHLAAASGKAESVKLLLQRGSDVNCRTLENITPLHEACYHRKIDVVSLLLENGADVDATTNDGKTPLLIAVEKRYNDIVSELLCFIPDIDLAENKIAFRVAVDSFCIGTVTQLSDYGFHFDKCDAKDTNLLWTCVENGYVELAKELLDQGSDIHNRSCNGKTLLHAAMKNSWTDLEMTELLLSYGIDVNVRDANGQTPLFYAVATGRTVFEIGQLVHPPQYHASRVLNVAVINKLLSKGAEVSAYDSWGTTPLHIAVFQQDYEIANLLLENGAEPNRRHNDGTIPLHIAAQRCDMGLVRTLIRYGSNVNEQDWNGYTPLHFAVISQHLQMVALLLEEGADIDTQRAEGSFPIHLATVPGSESVLELLVAQGADLEVEDAIGRRPLHLAASRGLVMATSLLLASGAYVDVRTDDGRTPLHDAVVRGYTDVIAVLLAGGADPDMRAVGETPLHAAITRSVEVTAQLIEAGAEIDSKDCHGQTPLLLAARSAAADVADLLLRHGADPLQADLSGSVALDFVHLNDPSRTIDRVFARAVAIRAAANILPPKFLGERINFRHECLVEADFIRAKPLIPGVTFHSVLNAPLRSLTKYARNADVQKLLVIFDFVKLYPLFGTWIKSKLNQGKVRNYLLEESSELLQVIINFKIPFDIIQDIVNNLSNSELRNFISSKTIFEKPIRRRFLK